jgi:hypothetical protein
MTHLIADWDRGHKLELVWTIETPIRLNNANLRAFSHAARGPVNGCPDAHTKSFIGYVSFFARPRILISSLAFGCVCKVGRGADQMGKSGGCGGGSKKWWPCGAVSGGTHVPVFRAVGAAGRRSGGASVASHRSQTGRGLIQVHDVAAHLCAARDVSLASALRGGGDLKGGVRALDERLGHADDFEEGRGDSVSGDAVKVPETPGREEQGRPRDQSRVVMQTHLRAQATPTRQYFLINK